MDNNAKTVSLVNASDVNDAVIEKAKELFDMWFDNDDEPIDWNSFWDRFETMFGFNITQTDCGASKKIQAIIRKYRNEF